ncbi:MAG: TIGR03086 family metal-binding protein [Streptosporangiales bacterium]
MTEIASRYRKLAAEFTRHVADVPEEHWEDPSPCAGWTAGDVLRHVHDFHQHLPEYAGLSLDLPTSVDDRPLDAWVEARDAMQALLDDPERAGAEYDGMFGRTSVEQTVDQFVNFDLLIHGWDIARATGQDETLPADEVKQAYEGAVALGDNLRRDGVCGPEVPVSADAPLQDRLLGLLGRTP